MELSSCKLIYITSGPARCNSYVTSITLPTGDFAYHNQRDSLKPGVYSVKIDSELKHGVLNYGELIIKGEVDDEVFLSTYICHPSMANNELSGPVVGSISTVASAAVIHSIYLPYYFYTGKQLVQWRTSVKN